LPMHVHIVAHDVPWPADFGGLVDLFYKIKHLHQLGVAIHLHCFTHGRSEQPELKKYCETVQYYPRKRNLLGFSFKLPFIVKSRADATLLQRLAQDNHPVLLEGIHCTYPLYAGALKDRPVLVRLHNVEFEYYRHLARYERNWFKKAYYWHESRLLHRYEQAIANKAVFLTVSEQDSLVYKNQFAAERVHFLPVFSPHTMAVYKEGLGTYCLYHGNLAVNENEKAAKWLLTEVFGKTKMPFVIAGRQPSAQLKRMAHRQQHTCLVANPNDAEMNDLIARAQIHVLPSFNNTGVKLKLLNAVFNGRHCLANGAAVAGSGLERYCHVAEDAAGFGVAIEELFRTKFTEQSAEERQGALQHLYNNRANAEKIISLLS
jgi:glycosyltransferase involved in cell wall biosynthesis